MRADKKSNSWLTAMLLAPTTMWFLFMLILPLIVIFVYSFGERHHLGGYGGGFTFEHYLNLPARLKAFQNTMTFAPVGTLLSLLVAYPLAYYLALVVDRRYKLILLVLVIVPFWTSLLIRTYAWIYILGGRGIPSLLEMIGLDDVRLINTPGAVLVGIVYGYLPLMVFPIYVSLEKLDKTLLEASNDLGGSPFKTFMQITLPLSMPGIATGCMLVFILLMGEFLINALVDLFLQSRNWPFGSAIAVALVAIMLITVSFYMRMTLRSKTGRDESLM